MIKSTLKDLVEAESALASLMQLRLPPKSAYHLAKLGRLVNQETEHFRKQREALIKEYGEERDATPQEQQTGQSKVMQVKPDNVEKFLERIKELGAVEVTIDWNPVKMDMLEGQTVRGAELMQLGNLFEE